MSWKAILGTDFLSATDSTDVRHRSITFNSDEGAPTPHNGKELNRALRRPKWKK